MRRPTGGLNDEECTGAEAGSTGEGSVEVGSE